MYDNCFRILVSFDDGKQTYRISRVTEDLLQILINNDVNDSGVMSLQYSYRFVTHIWIPQSNHVIRGTCHQQVQLLTVVKAVHSLQDKA